MKNQMCSAKSANPGHVHVYTCTYVLYIIMSCIPSMCTYINMYIHFVHVHEGLKPPPNSCPRFAPLMYMCVCTCIYMYMYMYL